MRVLAIFCMFIVLLVLNGIESSAVFDGYVDHMAGCVFRVPVNSTKTSTAGPLKTSPSLTKCSTYVVQHVQAIAIFCMFIVLLASNAVPQCLTAT